MSVHTSVTHKLKSWTMFFEDILSGDRTSDIRSTLDRRFLVGDILELHEFDPVKFIYTGRVQQVKVTYVQQNKSNPCAISRQAINDNFVVLSIKLVGELSNYLAPSEGIKVTGPIYAQGAGFKSMLEKLEEGRVIANPDNYNNAFPPPILATPPELIKMATHELREEELGVLPVQVTPSFDPWEEKP